MRRRGAVLAVLLVGAAPGALAAQTADPVAQAGMPQDLPDDEEDPDGGMAPRVEEIVVTGARPRGSVIGDIEPEQVLDPGDIRAYGVSSIAELMTELEPLTGSGQGRGGEAPVVLLSGRRISGFREIRDIPTEAIERVDILPPEVALKDGYSATQRVVNIVLRERFRAVTTELEGRMPTAGGTSEIEADLDILRINPDGRENIDIEYERQSPLLESERDIIADAGEAGDPSMRSLRGKTDSLEIDGVIARTLFGNVATSFTASVEASDSLSLLGLPEGTAGAAEPLERDSSSRDLHLGFSANGNAADWRWTLTGNFDREQSNTRTEREVATADGPGRYDRSRSISNVGRLDGVLNGELMALPAGDVSTTLKFGARTIDLDGRSMRDGVVRDSAIARDSGNAQLNLDLPIASRRRAVLDGIGDLSLNGNVAIDRLSDFGTLMTWGTGINWSPIPELRLLGSFTREEGAPSPQQIGDPVIATPNVRVFDFVTGETVDITRIDGGNPALSSDGRDVLKIGMHVTPLSDTDLNLRADYVRSTIDDPIASFPTATAEIEAAFPDRFVRDPSGRLVSIDNRPVNFRRSEREELRWGINLSLPVKGSLQKRMEEAREGGGDPRAVLREAYGRPPRERRRGGAQGQAPLPPEGSATPQAQASREADRPRLRERRGGGRGFRGGRFGGGRRGGGRFQIGLHHVWKLKETILIREGLPLLDLLDGSATGSRGGQPRHEVDLRTGFTKDGLGIRVHGEWQSGTRVDGGVGGEDDMLYFSDQTTFDVRLFANLGSIPSLARDHRWLRGTRVTFAVNNLFDHRLEVTDAGGATPIGYQPDLLDPLGRTVRLSVRKLF